MSKEPCSIRHQLRRAIEDIYSFPLRQVAVDILNRQLRSGISDEDLAERVVELREEGRLCIVHEEEESQEPRIICSLGLALPEGGQLASSALRCSHSSARKKEERKVGIADKTVDDSGIKLLESLIVRGNESLQDVLVWLAEQWTPGA